MPQETARGRRGLSVAFVCVTSSAGAVACQLHHLGLDFLSTWCDTSQPRGLTSHALSQGNPSVASQQKLRELEQRLLSWPDSQSKGSCGVRGRVRNTHTQMQAATCNLIYGKMKLNFSLRILHLFISLVVKNSVKTLKKTFNPNWTF